VPFVFLLAAILIGLFARALWLHHGVDYFRSIRSMQVVDGVARVLLRLRERSGVAGQD